MLTFWDVISRIDTGPVCVEHDFDLKIFVPKLREVIREYDIKFDAENPVPSDDSLADDVFEAALDLYVDTGTFCLDAKRVIKFTEEEVKEAIRHTRDRLLFGEGKDAQAMVHRSVEDRQEPFCIGTPAGHPVSEELFIPILQSYAQNPWADIIGMPNPLTIFGMENKANTPIEVMASIWSVRCFREVASRVGRPGLSSHNISGSVATATIPIIASTNPIFGVRKNDGTLSAILPELKIDYERLNKTAYLLEAGYSIGTLSGPLLGGLPGGPEGVAVTTIANLFQGMLVNRGDYTIFFPIDVMTQSNTSRKMLWALGVSGQAMSKKTKAVFNEQVFAAAGPCTDMVLYELAATLCAIITSGADCSCGIVAKNKYLDRCSGFESEFGHEVAHALAGVKRSDANEIAKRLLTKYEDKIVGAPKGKKFQECYDVKNVQPTKEYIELHKKIKRELEEIGIEFNFSHMLQ